MGLVYFMDGHQVETAETLDNTIECSIINSYKFDAMFLLFLKIHIEHYRKNGLKPGNYFKQD